MQVCQDKKLGHIIEIIDETGIRHTIPWNVGVLGLGVIERHRDPFEPGWFPDEAIVAAAYIAMANALRS